MDISREVFEDFLKTFNVFAEFWKCALVFGRKSEENEFEFPGFRTKRSQTSGGKSEAIGASLDILSRAWNARNAEVRG